MNPLAAILLWLSMLALLLANNALGDVQIALASGTEFADRYKSIVPLPYIALCAWVLARRRPPGAGLGDALAVGLLWALSTVVVMSLLARYLQGVNWRLAFQPYRLWDGYWFALVPLAQALLPPLFYRLIAPLAGPGGKPPLG